MITVNKKVVLVTVGKGSSVGDLTLNGSIMRGESNDKTFRYT
jgi:hypothetical protein